MSTSKPPCIIRDLSTGIVHCCVAGNLDADIERRTWIRHYTHCGLSIWEDRKWRKRNRHRQADKGLLCRPVDTSVTCIECLGR